MNTITFTVPGRIIGKQRPRHIRGRKTPYTPQKTKAAETALGWSMKAAMGSRAPFDRAVAVSVRIYLHHPKDWSKARKIGAVHATGKPDADNALKTIFDAGNGILWVDDALISAVTFQRTYTTIGPERAEITVTPLLDLPIREAGRNAQMLLQQQLPCPSITRSAS